MEAATTAQKPPSEERVSSFAKSLYKRGEYGYAFFGE